MLDGGMSCKPLECILAIDAFMLAVTGVYEAVPCPASHPGAARPNSPKPCVQWRPCCGIAKLVPASVGELLAAGESHCRCGGDGRLNAAMNAAGKASARPPAARSLDKCRTSPLQGLTVTTALRMRK